MDQREITDDMLDEAVKCESCDSCKMKNLPSNCTRILASTLKKEREERKNNPGVWGGIPKTVSQCIVVWEFVSDGKKLSLRKEYTRTLPKSRAREIAERRAKAVFGKLLDTETLTEIIESAIIAAQK